MVMKKTSYQACVASTTRPAQTDQPGQGNTEEETLREEPSGRRRLLEEQIPPLLPTRLAGPFAGLLLARSGNLEEGWKVDSMGAFVAFVQRDHRGKPRLITLLANTAFVVLDGPSRDQDHKFHGGQGLPTQLAPIIHRALAARAYFGKKEGATSGQVEKSHPLHIVLVLATMQAQMPMSIRFASEQGVRTAASLDKPFHQRVRILDDTVPGCGFGLLIGMFFLDLARQRGQLVECFWLILGLIQCVTHQLIRVPPSQFDAVVRRGCSPLKTAGIEIGKQTQSLIGLGTECGNGSKIYRISPYDEQREEAQASGT